MDRALIAFARGGHGPRPGPPPAIRKLVGKFSTYCGDCHSTSDDLKNRKGPSLFGIIGRKARTVSGVPVFGGQSRLRLGVERRHSADLSARSARHNARHQNEVRRRQRPQRVGHHRLPGDAAMNAPYPASCACCTGHRQLLVAALFAIGWSIIPSRPPRPGKALMTAHQSVGSGDRRADAGAGSRCGAARGETEAGPAWMRLSATAAHGRALSGADRPAGRRLVPPAPKGRLSPISFWAVRLPHLLAADDTLADTLIEVQETIVFVAGAGGAASGGGALSPSGAARRRAGADVAAGACARRLNDQLRPEAGPQRRRDAEAVLQIGVERAVARSAIAL